MFDSGMEQQRLDNLLFWRSGKNRLLGDERKGRSKHNMSAAADAVIAVARNAILIVMLGLRL